MLGRSGGGKGKFSVMKTRVSLEFKVLRGGFEYSIPMSISSARTICFVADTDSLLPSTTAMTLPSKNLIFKFEISTP
jgi:hypothetical protein